MQLPEQVVVEIVFLRQRILERRSFPLFEDRRRGASFPGLSVVAEVGVEVNIRERIEQIEAQKTRLRNQVAYSTIQLTLESTAVVTKTERPQRSAGSVVQEAWSQSTKAVRNLTLSLVSLGIWLLTFSPYLLAIAAAIYGYKRLRPAKSRPIKSLPADPKSTPPESDNDG